MDKRYQVFISSTFADLEEERKGIMQAIIELDCFPAGMEMFPASDTEQFEFIKPIIDESDYYVLIIAGRYGSIAEDGFSYTEKEFDYAKEKGIPILAFVKKDIDSIPANKIEKNQNRRKKLEAFRNKALDGRMANFWDNEDDLKNKIQLSLFKEFKSHPRIGWIRGNTIPSYEVLEKMSQLQEENKNLIIRLQDYDNKQELDSNSSSKLSKMFTVNIQPEVLFAEIELYNISIKEIINKTGLDLRSGVWIYEFRSMIDEIVNSGIGKIINGTITEDSLQDIEKKMLALGIIDIDDTNSSTFLKFTDYGEEVFIQSIEF